MKNLKEINNELLLANKILKEKNTELLRSNIELASFNHVVSHDLQEPLRKIQLFISRIPEDADQRTSEKNQDYLKKIQTSANRMQLLIDDLLAYSRVNANNKFFEPTFLDSIIENIINEFEQAQIIEDKNAIINYSGLPEIQAIPFQITQLFTNLIGNALKYSIPGRSPIININAVVVKGSEVLEENANQNLSYYKITVEDNGMGFEQEYAEKIFTLFQRLHDKQAFSGTGIGLTICKKIVENHDGFISATSVLNKGSIFSIYLPITK